MKSTLPVIATFFGVFIVLTVTFLAFDAFERLYEFSRMYESWEMDEIIMALFAAIVASIAAMVILTRKNIRLLRREIAARETLEREAATTRHLRALGTLAGGISHSANNFLQPILTLARLSRSNAPDDKVLQENLDRIIESASDASRLFNGVLSFSQPDAPTSVTEIREALVRIEPLIRVSIGSGYDVHFDIAAGGNVAIDRTSLTDVVLVLVKNAADAIDDTDGRIAISTAKPDDGFIELRIADNGTGMSEDVRQRAFDPFFTTKDVDKGTGLGLSIVQSLIERAGGTIELQPQDTGGTVAIVRLPEMGETR